MSHEAAAGRGTGAATPVTTATFKAEILDNLRRYVGKFPMVATLNDYYLALAYTVRDHMLVDWVAASRTYLSEAARTVVYLSAEFLMGPQLETNLAALDLREVARRAVSELGVDFDALVEQEEEPGLGNGGLGRLAACFMDSLATLQIPSIGYGIRYEFGIFDQEIRDGWQVEITDKWLRLGNPWEIARPEIAFDVKLGGRTEPYTDEQGSYRVRWVPGRVVRGVPYDTPIPGYRVGSANFLRLWKAEAAESFDFAEFNVGHYWAAVDEKVASENITKVLYPNDEPEAGKELRLAQQYFLVSCSLQDMIRLYSQRVPTLDQFGEKFAAQLNDTHPALAIPELMRLLVDEHGLPWERAWEITTQTFGYTNHTLLPEALETWSLPLFARLLPRHLEIIFEINRRFLDRVRAAFPGDDARIARMSLIDERGERRVRMANLAAVGSHAINGVAKLHSELLKQSVMRDFHELWPEKFSNKTNGVTPRRFILVANPGLASLLTDAVGAGWERDLERLRGLEEVAADASFQERWRAVKKANKERLAGLIAARTGIEVDPSSLFDVLVKRIHEYKRQHLKALHVVALYNRIKRNPGANVLPRTFVFGGKAAPGYTMAKLIIKLVTSIGDIVNADADVAGRLRVVFFPDFNVKNAQPIYPAAELSEQISLAGKEASGTGNMKFSLNGALTVGTLDGANVEIREQVGAENFFLFGMTVDDVARRLAGGYDPRAIHAQGGELRDAIDAIASGVFSPDDPHRFRPLVDNLLGHDPYMVLADFESYLATQDRIARAYREPAAWTRMSILNCARTGYFSSDRAIREYCDEIWRVAPVRIPG